MVQHSNGKISDYKKGVIKKVSDLIIPLLPTAFDVVGKKKVSDLFIPLLPTAFDAVGSFCFYFFFI